jgi:hypothetical protein
VKQSPPWYLSRSHGFLFANILLTTSPKSQLRLTKVELSFKATTMDVLELKREIEMLAKRLGKTQDYL